MPSVDFSQVITGTPAPYDPSAPAKQRENLAAVWMEIMDQLATQGETLDIDLVEIIKALQFQNMEIHWGEIKIILTNHTASVQQT